MWIGHRQEIRKLMFRALALGRSETLENVSPLFHLIIIFLSNCMLVAVL